MWEGTPWLTNYDHRLLAYMLVAWLFNLSRANVISTCSLVPSLALVDGLLSKPRLPLLERWTERNLRHWAMVAWFTTSRMSLIEISSGTCPEVYTVPCQLRRVYLGVKKGTGAFFLCDTLVNTLGGGGVIFGSCCSIRFLRWAVVRGCCFGRFVFEILVWGGGLVLVGWGGLFCTGFVCCFLRSWSAVIRVLTALVCLSTVERRAMIASSACSRLAVRGVMVWRMSQARYSTWTGHPPSRPTR